MSEAKPFQSSASPPPQKKPESLDSFAKTLPGRVFKPGALFIIFTLAIGAGVALGGDALVGARVDSRVDAGVKKFEPRIEQLEQSTKANAEALQRLDAKFDAAEERQARRFEVMINTVLERQRQPGTAELSRPAKDGGP